MPPNMPPAPDASLLDHVHAHWSVLISYWPVFAISFGLSLVLTPLCRSFALKKDIVDKPDNWLKPHGAPIAYLGGVAIFLGWLAGVLYGYFQVEVSAPGLTATARLGDLRGIPLVGIMLAGAGIMLLGLMDDLRVMSPKTKLAGTIAVAVLLIGFGLGEDIIVVVTNRFRVYFEDHERWLMLTYSIPITVFIVVGACNATNLLDGLDGLCGGVVGIISLGFLILAVHLRVHSPGGASEVLLVVLCMAMLGGALGFLPFNRHPAKVFMGDAGSMLLGLNSAIVLLLFADEQRFRWMLASLVIFGLPIADMVLTLARRWRCQRPLMEGDRSHFYDQLVDRGLSVRAVVRISYILAAMFAFLGLLPTFMRGRHLVLVYGLVVLALAYVAHKFKMVRAEDPRPTNEKRG